MTKNIIMMAVISALLLTSCEESQKQDVTETTTTDATGHNADDIVSITSEGKDGKQLEITFNNTKGTATANLEGETIELHQEKAASF